MSDGNKNDNVISSVVEASKKAIVVTITLSPNGRLEVQAPNNPITVLGMIEMAKRMVGPQEKKEQIFVPQIGPKRTM